MTCFSVLFPALSLALHSAACGCGQVAQPIQVPNADPRQALMEAIKGGAFQLRHIAPDRGAAKPQLSAPACTATGG